MRQISGDIWDYHPGAPICVTTNGVVKRDGTAVMGAGVALQALERYPDFSRKLGHAISKFGNRVFYFHEYNIVTFPVKHHFRELADLALIARSARQLVGLVKRKVWRKIVVPRPGCGCGRLSWDTVRPVLEKIWGSDAFLVISR